MINLKGKPFFLTDEEIEWVERTKKSMDLDEKVGQLFIAHGFSFDTRYLTWLLQNRKYGGVMYRPADSKEVQKIHQFWQENVRIPLLIGANLEYGGNGIATDGTRFGQQMQIAATDDSEFAYKLGKVSCAEGAAVGCNWTYAPVIDIDYNFRNPITNVRTYGNDPKRVLTMAREYIRSAEECGVAVTIKHFPGDGMDERDQHLVVSVNTMSCEEWDRTYGVIYKELIDAGAMTLMAGSISLPSYQKKFNRTFPEKSVPASLSPELLQGLLRGKLGFNGLITSDSSVMVGLSAVMPREEMLPAMIESGCDMIMFTRDEEEDFRYMKEGYEKGLLSEKRMDEALTRILALKAALKLPQKQKEGNLVPAESALSVIGCEQFTSWARECAEKSVTLVKDTQKLLPISPEKHRKILLEIMGIGSQNERVTETMVHLLEKEGFEVHLYEPDDFSNIPALDGVEAIKRKYDLVMYVANEENTSNKTATRLRWHTAYGLGNNTPWFSSEVPTMFISVANPYHLLDVPMIKTYINGYSNSEFVLEAIVDKILGRSEFKGKSPIDPFCGKEDTKY